MQGKYANGFQCRRIIDVGGALRWVGAKNSENYKRGDGSYFPDFCAAHLAVDGYASIIVIFSLWWGLRRRNNAV